jgi:hypothetical protein
MKSREQQDEMDVLREVVEYEEMRQAVIENQTSLVGRGWEQTLSPPY